VKAYTQKEKIRNKYTGLYEEPDERLMRSIEEKIDIPDSRKDDFRREIMNYIGALAIEGKTFNYRTNERLQKALELKLFEDQKDSIKLKTLVSSVVDKETQEKIDVVRGRLIKNFGVRRRERDRRAQLRGEHLRPRGRQGVTRISAIAVVLLGACATAPKILYCELHARTFTSSPRTHCRTARIVRSCRCSRATSTSVLR